MVFFFLVFCLFVCFEVVGDDWFFVDLYSLSPASSDPSKAEQLFSTPACEAHECCGVIPFLFSLCFVVDGDVYRSSSPAERRRVEEVAADEERVKGQRRRGGAAAADERAAGPTVEVVVVLGRGSGSGSGGVGGVPGSSAIAPGKLVRRRARDEQRGGERAAATSGGGGPGGAVDRSLLGQRRARGSRRHDACDRSARGRGEGVGGGDFRRRRRRRRASAARAGVVVARDRRVLGVAVLLLDRDRGGQEARVSSRGGRDDAGP